VSPVCIDFIKQLLIKDPRKRITIDEALKHKFFNNKEVKLQAGDLAASMAAGSGETKQI
jgi:serine/threonine protein kinase